MACVEYGAQRETRRNMKNEKFPWFCQSVRLFLACFAFEDPPSAALLFPPGATFPAHTLPTAPVVPRPACSPGADSAVVECAEHSSTTERVHL